MSITSTPWYTGKAALESPAENRIAEVSGGYLKQADVDGKWCAPPKLDGRYYLDMHKEPL